MRSITNDVLSNPRGLQRLLQDMSAHLDSAEQRITALESQKKATKKTRAEK